MTPTQWLSEFNKILLRDFENRDDDLFLQVMIIERYLSAYGHIPNDPNTFHKIEKAVLFYINEVIPKIGEFPHS